MNKNIIILGPAHPYRGGIAAFSHRLAQELKQAGHKVTIFNFTLQYPSLLFPGKTQYSHDSPPPNVEITRSLSSINPFTWWRTAQRIRAMAPDIVIVRYWIPFMAPSLGTVLKLVKKSVGRRIAIVDNIIPHEKRIGDRQLSQYFVNQCDEFVVMSKQVKEQLQEFNSNKPIKFHNHPIYDNYGEAIDKNSAKIALNLDVNTNYLLFFGLIRAYKGLDLLLNAIDPNLFKKYNLKLIVAGEFYDDKSKYTQIINDNSLQDFVIVHDFFIPNDDVKKYFCAADLVVQPYKTATQSGISQIAYHFDKPMVVTDVGGLPDIVENNVSGFIVNQTPDSIAKAIQKFYDDGIEIQFQHAVREKKKEFSWDRFVEILLEETVQD